MSVNKNSTNGLHHPAKPIHWQEGIFLQPQHFQWQDLYLQSQIDPLARYLQPFFWGSGYADIHEESLSNNVFNVLSGEFRFRDQTHVIYPGNAVLESRNFEKAWKDKGKPFSVYLGIRKLFRNGKNVSNSEEYDSLSLISTRFMADRDAEPLADLYAGGEELPIERMHFVLKILWEEEIKNIGDYEIIPIARLEHRKGDIVMMPEYIPPVLSIGGSNSLLQNIRAINELISSTANRLERQKKDRGVQTAEFGTKDMVFLFTLRTLNRCSPLLRHILNIPGCVHPWSAYAILCQLVGELSTFSSKINLINIDKDNPFYLLEYDHEELTQCFKRCRYILARLMADISSEPEYVVPFAFNGENFSAELTLRLSHGRKRFFLAVETEASVEQVIAELENQAKVSSPRHLSKLIIQSLPGIELKHVPNPPPELPRRSMGIYFALNHKNQLWNKVIEDQKLALSWDTRPKDVRIELMVAGGDE
jgi:type VI secretion system protein ImpJ